ncbi:hypothetical protein EXU85_20290 [Spirosoma sp. KCTC 42546]|uniref:hypothetical protein n=1 Tax=Spirosoma sp. KCTC 42546 TaxID=2520506 RepID=UPI00115814A6|nr:hypothetical protein [Spirosoma sp. KCTC 42546]QDK80819.1 hypothetical protein EXU85_20290 [Spirosoma sp. KCTC 42546]
MAQNAAKTLSMPDDWQKAFLQKIASDEETLSGLFDLLYRMWNFRDTPSSEGLQVEMFSHWVGSENVDLNQYRYEIRDFVSHLNDVNKLKEEFEFFNTNSGYTTAFKPKKEVSHD